MHIDGTIFLNCADISGWNSHLKHQFTYGGGEKLLGTEVFKGPKSKNIDIYTYVLALDQVE